MDDFSIKNTSEQTKKAVSSETGFSEDDCLDLARCHHYCLRQTNSSLAGVDALKALYQIMIDDPNSFVLWQPGIKGSKLQTGAFVAGTSNIKETRARIKSRLPKMLLLRLAFWNLVRPARLVANIKWSLMKLDQPHHGYIVTLGATPQVNYPSDFVRPKGSQMLDAIETFLKSKGLNRILVDAKKENQAARKFYHAHGYKEINVSFGHVLYEKGMPDE